MTPKTKVFYNVVLDVDLFFTIYDYLRFNREACHDYKIFSTDNFNDLSYEDWVYLAHDTVKWLTNEQLPKVYSMKDIDVSPQADTWGTLYYQTLNYMSIKGIRESIHNMTTEQTVEKCKSAIQYLKSKIDEMREPTDYDLENI